MMTTTLSHLHPFNSSLAFYSMWTEPLFHSWIFAWQNPSDMMIFHTRSPASTRLFKPIQITRLYPIPSSQDQILSFLNIVLISGSVTSRTLLLALLNILVAHQCLTESS